MKHANLLPVLIEMFEEFRAPAFKEHMTYLETELWRECPLGKMGMDDLPEEARRHVVPVATFFFTVGVLVANEVIDARLASSYMGRSILRAWTLLEPYIHNERQRRNDEHHLMFFENLAYLVSLNPPSKLNATLKLHNMPPSTRVDEAAS
jgi:hypothetical protein